MDVFILTAFIMTLTLAQVTQSEEIELRGAGATFPGEIYEAWSPAFENDRKKFIEIDNEYSSIGSGLGIRLATGQVSDVNIDYYATDAMLTEAEKGLNPDLQAFPVLAGPVALAYNLDDIDNLNLTMDLIVGIYNGTYTLWNDSAIAAVNTYTTMPDAKIRVIARADDAGTTEIFTAALSRFSAEWNATRGRFSEGLDEADEPIRWDPDVMSLYGRTNRGVSGIILSYRRSIGYLSMADAIVSQVHYANIIDSNGNILDFNVNNLKDAMVRSVPSLGSNMTLDLMEFAAEGDYPIFGFSYFLVNMETMPDCAGAQELVRYIEWFMESEFARKEIRDFEMEAIPHEICQQVTDRVLKNMKCEGKDLYELVQRQKQEEWESTQTWRLPVLIASCVVALLVILMIVYIVFQQVKLRHAILTDDWKIKKDEVQLKWTKEDGLMGSPTGQSAISLTLSAVSGNSYSAARHVIGVGVWNQKVVCLREIQIQPLNIQNIEVKKRLIWMRDKIQNTNVLRLYGLSFMDNSIYFVSEHAPKGTLSDVVQNEKYRIDDNIKFSLALDIATGMAFLHNNGIIHGKLQSEACFIDQRWNVKVTDWENHNLSELNRSAKRLSQVMPVKVNDFQIIDLDDDPVIRARNHFWTAPEQLTESLEGSTKAGDVYSFSIILVEIFSREDPYSELGMTMEAPDILNAIKEKKIRPNISLLQPKSVHKIISRSWNEDPEERPAFSSLKKTLRQAKPSKKSVMDAMMEVLEGYVNQLEEKVNERTAELAAANQSMENLLHQILPPSVADSLSRGEHVSPETFESVTIYFSDIVGFTTLSARSSPMEVVAMLNDLYTAFDSVIDQHDVYKVETIGDAYMVISGLPARNGLLHAPYIATMALDLIATAKVFKIRHLPKEKLNLRAGIHTGPVVAGVVGLKMPRYCLFGDTVNTASRMESTSLAMQIQASETTHNILTKVGGFQSEIRGDIEVKGKGKMKTYFITGKDGYVPTNGNTS